MDDEIKELYRIFKPYRLGNDFTGCEHCVSHADCERLKSVPLQELTISDVDSYASKAMTTWGDVRHFKHFVPRLLELAFEDYLGFTFPEVLFGKLACANWTAWPKTEQDAIQNFLDQFWIHQLNSPGQFPDQRIRTVLGGLSQACSSLLPYLAIWSNQTPEAPAFHLAQLITDSSDQIISLGAIDLWGNPTPHRVELVEWLSSYKPLRLLETNREAVNKHFPTVFSQWDGIRKEINNH
jgi:hypothetical protein